VRSCRPPSRLRNPSGRLAGHRDSLVSRSPCSAQRGEGRQLNRSA
jgi:hypothetical protein